MPESSYATILEAMPKTAPTVLRVGRMMDRTKVSILVVIKSVNQASNIAVEDTISVWKYYFPWAIDIVELKSYLL